MVQTAEHVGPLAPALGVGPRSSLGPSVLSLSFLPNTPHLAAVRSCPSHLCWGVWEAAVHLLKLVGLRLCREEASVDLRWLLWETSSWFWVEQACVTPTGSPHIALLSAPLDCPPIQDHMALNVTSSGFQMSWSMSPPRSRDFYVQVYRGEQLLQSTRTGDLALRVSGLEAGVLYTVRTSYQGCGANVSAELAVKTGEAPWKSVSPLEMVFLSQVSRPQRSLCPSCDFLGGQRWLSRAHSVPCGLRMLGVVLPGPLWTPSIPESLVWAHYDIGS